ncbi:troponin T, cardiac muscle-like [Branchiostoma floridae]|uniref:Troponin T, cardiac muscle-like n=1 Tax=Branchiostoma floridae TaxID=7739 RepID=A0A9J7LR71_BRAFL|nr:troponin T, cardiac muscle-like [Branchiostoma floridae]
MASFQSDFENYSDEEENLFQPRLPTIQEEVDSEISEWEWDSEEDLEEKKANEQEDEEMAQKVKEDPEEKKEAREKEGDGEAEEGNITWTSPYPGLKENSSSDEEGGNDDAKILKKQLSLARAEISAKELNINKQAQDINRLIKRNFELIDENKEFNRSVFTAFYFCFRFNVSAKEKKMARNNTALKCEVKELKARLLHFRDECDRDLEEYLIEKRALEADIQDEQEKNEQLKRELEETKKASGRFAEVKELFEVTVEHEQAENERLRRDLEKANDAAEELAKAKDSLQSEVQQEQAENEKLKKYVSPG